MVFLAHGCVAWHATALRAQAQLWVSPYRLTPGVKQVSAVLLTPKGSLMLQEDSPFRDNMCFIASRVLISRDSPRFPLSRARIARL